MKSISIYILMAISIAAMLAVVFVANDSLPSGELSVQWAWLAKSSVFFAVCTLIALFIGYKRKDVNTCFYNIVIWILIILGGGEAIYGLWQIYGLASSNHSLYALTGSFFNPGPYSGYLAMVFPLCLNEWLQLKRRSNRIYIEQAAYYLAGGILLLILCVLPAGMSRSAWLAAFVSGIWICGMHYSWGERVRNIWQTHQRRVIGVAILGLVCLIMGGAALFYLKKDSANGRLFMWKISCQAIAKHPMSGYGINGFAYAYGAAQEEYFAKGDYSLDEELVAGSPDYAFNEYLQLAIEWGVSVLVFALLFIGFCLWRGVSGKRLSACGGVISLLVFSFSSYPMQLPAFFIAFLLLLAVCGIGRSRSGMVLLAVIIGTMGLGLWKKDVSDECKEWSKTKALYNIGAYKAAKEGYQKLYPALKNRGTFLFEYGHCLHKLNEYDASNEILRYAANHSSDPMILNIIGKNYQEMKCYSLAEEYLIRSTHRLPGRIYPYYLLAKLYAECDMPDKAEEMAKVVLTKEPKVQSTAVKEMRVEMRKMINK